jgi:hypothetical protein
MPRVMPGCFGRPTMEGKTARGGVIAGEATLAHAGAVVDYERLYIYSSKAGFAGDALAQNILNS